jgi:hypothetical protein
VTPRTLDRLEQTSYAIIIASVIALVFVLSSGCGPKTKPILVKFDAAALTAVQEIARIEREQSALGNLAPADALAVRKALAPVISLGLTATDALLAWEPGQPVPPEMLKLSTELGALLTTAALRIKNDTAKLAIVIAIAAAQQAWQVAILTMQGGQAPELTPALVGGGVA